MAIDETYIQTSETAIQDILYNTLCNMSFLLNDRLGQVWDRESRIVTRNLNVNATGEVVGIGGSMTLPNDVLLGQESFQPALSHYAVEIYGRLLISDTNYVYVTELPNDTELSMVLKYTTGLSGEVTSYMSYLYLELYSLFIAITKYRAGEILKMTVPEIETIASNARYIHAKIGTMGDQENVYNLVNVLKHIQRSILFVKKGILSILG